MSFVETADFIFLIQALRSILKIRDSYTIHDNINRNKLWSGERCAHTTFFQFTHLCLLEMSWFVYQPELFEQG